MARVPYVDDVSNPQLKPIADRIRAERGGRLLNLYRVLLNSPQLADAWRHLFTVIRQQCELPARERELVIMAIAVMNGADYEYSHHAPIALGAGLTQAQLDALPHWRNGNRLSPLSLRSSTAPVFRKVSGEILAVPATSSTVIICSRI